jgi:hypothetical protein
MGAKPPNALRAKGVEKEEEEEEEERVFDTYCIGGWVECRVCLDAVVKRKIPSPCRDSNLPIIQPVAKRDNR